MNWEQFRVVTGGHPERRKTDAPLAPDVRIMADLDEMSWCIGMACSIEDIASIRKRLGVIARRASDLEQLAFDRWDAFLEHSHDRTR